MVEVEVRYRDSYTNGRWVVNTYRANSIAECIKTNGFGVDCEFEILSWRKV